MYRHEQAIMGLWVKWALFGWVMGPCILTRDPPLFHQPSKSQ